MGRGRRLRVCLSVGCRLFRVLIVGVLSQCNHLLVVTELHLERIAVRSNRHVAVAEATDEVEGLAGRLLTRETHLVVRDALLDDRTHMGRRAEESVSRHEPLECLVGALEVVRVDEVDDAPVAIGVQRAS